MIEEKDIIYQTTWTYQFKLNNFLVVSEHNIINWTTCDFYAVNYRPIVLFDTE